MAHRILVEIPDELVDYINPIIKSSSFSKASILGAMKILKDLDKKGIDIDDKQSVREYVKSEYYKLRKHTVANS